MGSVSVADADVIDVDDGKLRHGDDENASSPCSKMSRAAGVRLAWLVFRSRRLRRDGTKRGLSN